MTCAFNLRHYTECVNSAKNAGYAFQTLSEFHRSPGQKVVLLRHDIDISPERAAAIAETERKLGVRSTFFVRVRKSKYYDFRDPKTLAFLKRVRDCGHEIGLHYETLDVAAITGGDPDKIMREDKRLLEEELQVTVRACSPHNDLTGICNQDFWKPRNKAGYGFDFDAYDAEFMPPNCFYSSDSRTSATDLIGRWKQGACFCELVGKHDKLCILTHPVYWPD